MATESLADRIRTAEPADAEACIGVLTRAFAKDPPCRWGWPEADRFQQAFPRFARAFAGRAFARGTAYYCAGHSGVALWLPPGEAPDLEALERLVDETVPDRVKGALFSMFEQMGAYHPAEAHWHLPLIGVDPACQGQGVGSALLAHALERCDEEHVLAYLEATSPLNRRLYERHGFAALGRVQVADSPPVVPMLRRPR
jgi:ribosomal protein S18 acetylase RimI-like enzyme